MALGPTDYRGAMAGRQPGMRPQATGNSPDTQTSTMSGKPRAATAPGAAPVARPKTIGQPDSMPLTASISRTTSAPAANSMVSDAAVSPASRPRMMKKGGLVRKGNVTHGKYSKKC